MKLFLTHLSKFKPQLQNSYLLVSPFSSLTMPKSSALNILGLNGNPSFQDIKRAYFLLSKRYHPDVDDSSVEKFKEIGEAYNTLKYIFRGESDDNEIQSFSLKNSHFNSYDGHLYEEDIQAFMKYSKGHESYGKHSNMKIDLKIIEDRIYQEIFGKSFEEDKNFFYDEKNKKLREKFESEMEKCVEKEKLNLSDAERKTVIYHVPRKRIHENHDEINNIKKRLSKMIKH